MHADLGLAPNLTVRHRTPARPASRCLLVIHAAAAVARPWRRGPSPIEETSGCVMLPVHEMATEFAQLSTYHGPP